MCAASISALKAAAQPVIEQGFDRPGLKYGVFPTTRCHTNLERLDLIRAVADIVTGLNNGHTVDLKNQERSILIELHKVIYILLIICVLLLTDRAVWGSAWYETTPASPRFVVLTAPRM